MTAEEALRQAETEGLTLLKSEGSRYSSITGYKYVHFDSSKSKPYKAEVQRGGTQVGLGNYQIRPREVLFV